jgi:hypothetical protein
MRSLTGIPPIDTTFILQDPSGRVAKQGRSEVLRLFKDTFTTVVIEHQGSSIRIYPHGPGTEASQVIFTAFTKIRPTADGSMDLGDTDYRWKDIHTDRIIFSDATEQITATGGGSSFVTFTAGENIAEGDIVYLSAASTVSKAATANAAKVVGVANAAISSAATGQVVILGTKTVTADGTVAVGDLITAAGTAGRGVAISAHDHDDVGAATTSIQFPNSTHTHTVSSGTGAGGDHTHTNATTSSPSGTTEVSTHNHSHTPLSTESGTHVHTLTAPAIKSVPSTAHTHTQGATGTDGDHAHTVGSTDAVAGGGTGSAATSNHSHTLDEDGIEGKIVGKAVTAASSGNTFTLLVTLS